MTNQRAVFRKRTNQRAVFGGEEPLIKRTNQRAAFGKEVELAIKRIHQRVVFGMGGVGCVSGWRVFYALSKR